MAETELTVEVFGGFNNVVKHLEENGFQRLETFTISDLYFSKFSKEEILTQSYEDMINSSLILREYSGDISKKQMLHKNKTYNANGDCISEEKTSCHIGSTKNASKLLINIGMSCWCQITQQIVVFKNQQMQFAVQDVDGVGTFIEYEERGNFSSLSDEEKIKTMKENLSSLGLNMRNNFFCKKVKMKIEAEKENLSQNKTPQTIIFASTNKGKLKEIKSIFNEYNIKGLDELNIKVEIEEDADSFYGNARKKAYEIQQLTNIPTIADDSGLCIDYFNGWPSVETHRFLGKDATPRQRNNAIINKLNGVEKENRTAQVVCALVYFDGTKELSAQGVIEGKIAFAPKGENGFGFDEIFELSDGRTMAECDSEEKNRLSARALACASLLQKLKNEN